MTIGGLLQLIASENTDPETPSIFNAQNLSFNVHKAKNEIIIDNNGECNFLLPRYGEDVTNLQLEFTDNKDTKWFPYSELKQFTIQNPHYSQDNERLLFKISGTTLLLLDALWFGENYVKMNIKFNRLSIPLQHIGTTVNNYNYVYSYYNDSLCTFHDVKKNRVAVDLLCKFVCKDVAKYIVEKCKSRSCTVCNGKYFSNFVYKPKKNSVAQIIATYFFYEQPFRNILQQTSYKFDTVEFQQEMTVKLEPGCTEYRVNISHFKHKVYQLVWAVVDCDTGLLTVDTDVVQESTLVTQDIERFKYDRYFSLVYDKNINGLKINSNYAVHSYTFADLYEDVKETKKSTLNFTRLDSVVLTVKTKEIDPDKYRFLHIFAINLSQIVNNPYTGIHHNDENEPTLPERHYDENEQLTDN